MKPYPPTMRERRRYISFKIHTKNLVSPREAGNAISSAAMSLLGESGYAEANFSIIELEGGRGIARTAHTKLEEAVFAITLVTELAQQPGWVEITGISGTLKKTRSEAKGI